MLTFSLNRNRPGMCLCAGLCQGRNIGAVCRRGGPLFIWRKRICSPEIKGEVAIASLGPCATEETPYRRAEHVLSAQVQLDSHDRSVEVWRVEWRLKPPPHLLTLVQDCESPSPIALK
ncbi:hypothetical protein TNCV_1373981 [Trichonephila clavipes]|nr:hypothetical protein TNCV_1373981 [Trichonephila clavipes]